MNVRDRAILNVELLCSVFEGRPLVCMSALESQRSQFSSVVCGTYACLKPMSRARVALCSTCLTEPLITYYDPFFYVFVRNCSVELRLRLRSFNDKK